MQEFVKMSSPRNVSELEDGFGNIMSDIEFWRWGGWDGEQLLSLDNT